MPATGPERIRRREGQDAAGTDAIGAGRHRDQAKRAVAADGLPLADEGGFAVAEWRRAENHRAPVPTVAKNAPASRAAPCRGGGSLSGRTRRRIAKRTHPKAISRLPSGAGRNARRPLARGKARLARSSPHDDRHRTNGTKLPRADRQAAIPAPRKKSPPVPDHAKNAFEPMFSGVRRIFGIIYPGFSGIRVLRQFACVGGGSLVFYGAGKKQDEDDEKGFRLAVGVCGDRMRRRAGVFRERKAHEGD